MPVPSVYVVPGAESINDLVDRIADRDQAAFGRLYHRLVRAVFTQVCESVGSPAIAVAVTRAVFVEVWRLAPMPASRTLDGLAWVTAIAARRAADRLREINDPTPGLGTGYDDLLGRELTVALGAEPAGAAQSFRTHTIDGLSAARRLLTGGALPAATAAHPILGGWRAPGRRRGPGDQRVTGVGDT